MSGYTSSPHNLQESVEQEPKSGQQEPAASISAPKEGSIHPADRLKGRAGLAQARSVEAEALSAFCYAEKKDMPVPIIRQSRGVCPLQREITVEGSLVSELASETGISENSGVSDSAKKRAGILYAFFKWPFKQS